MLLISLTTYKATLPIMIHFPVYSALYITSLSGTVDSQRRRKKPGVQNAIEFIANFLPGGASADSGSSQLHKFSLSQHPANIRPSSLRPPFFLHPTLWRLRRFFVISKSKVAGYPANDVIPASFSRLYSLAEWCL